MLSCSYTITEEVYAKQKKKENSSCDWCRQNMANKLKLFISFKMGFAR
jgi:hypothetical protein